MDKILLKQNIGKWNDACRFLKGHQADLSTAEWSAVELLADFWRTRKFDAELVEESKALIATLAEEYKLHSNNRDIITWIKAFRGIAKTMYTESAANFAEFQAAMREFTQEHAPRRPAPQPQPQRPNPQPRQPEPRPTPQPRRPQPQPRPTPTPPPPRRATLRITGVEFRNVDEQGNQVGTGVVDGSERIYYLRPLVNCQILEPSESKEVWYKIFSPGGQLFSGNSSRAGYTWRGVVNGRQDGWATLGGFGSNNGTTYTERGRYRVEFYENDVKVFETTVLIDGGAAGGASGGGAARRPQPTANIRITAVDFFETDGGNQVFGRARDGFTTRLRYVCPEITYTVLRTTADKDVWYKIYMPGGTLMTAVGGREGYTWKGKVNGRTGGTVSLGAFGGKDGTAFSEVGWYRVEFYENDEKIFESKFYVNQAPVQQSPQVEQIWDEYLNTNSPKKKRKKKWLVVAAILVGVWVARAWWTDETKPVAQPEVIKKMVFADKLVLRSSMDSETSRNQLGTLEYGTLVYVHSDTLGWAKVSVNGERGYVASDYLLGEKDFRFLNGVFASDGSRFVVAEAKYRLALLDFLKRENLVTGGGGYQLSAHREKNKTDDICEKVVRVDGKTLTCFAFVLTQRDNRERQLGIYDVSSMDEPQFLYSATVTETGGLKDIAYNARTKMWTYEIGNSTLTKRNSRPDSPKQKTYGLSGVMDVISGVFYATDYDGNVEIPKGKTLHTGMHYLQADVEFEALEALNGTYTYLVKIVRPDGKLERGQAAPDGYTFKSQVSFNAEKGERVKWTLPGWGNNDGNVYMVGTYTYEVWSEERQLWKKQFSVMPDSRIALQVNSGSFAGTDYDGNIVIPYGGKLRTNLQYLAVKLNITALMDRTDPLDYQVKIYRPDGTLERGNDSPVGYTFERRADCNIRKGESVDWILLGWGNVNGNAYRAGDYVYEVWVDGKRLWRQKFTVYPVGAE